jgi:hypothetical protein
MAARQTKAWYGTAMRSSRLFLLAALQLSLALAPACGGDDSNPANTPPADGGAGDGGASGPVTSLFIVPPSLDALADVHYYDHPWPSDLRRDPDGSVHFAGFYNPRLIPLINGYIKDTVGLLKGFSPAAFGYFRFTGDIDPKTLPAKPQDSLDPAASVQLIDVDPASPEHGKRKLVQTFWQQADGVYWLKDTLAVGPALGWPLRPNTHYAIVMTKKITTPTGTPIQPSDDLKEVLGVTPPTDHTKAAHDLFAPSLGEVNTAGVATADIVHFSAFTTNDPTADVFAITDDVRANVQAPTVDATTWMQMEQTVDYDVYQAVYGPSPNYQQGNINDGFAQVGDGGGFQFDANGKPLLSTTMPSFPMRFTFVIPNAQKCPPPAAGYPMVLYAHGTGGDYRSIVDEGNSLGQDFAQAPYCLASMGVDQIFHGTRPGAPPANDPNREGDIELLFFNFNNPIAGRTNGQQSAIDVVQQARLFTDTKVTVPANVSRTGAAISFDTTKLMFAGHSQGGLNGPLFLAADKQTRGGVLSGSGSMIIVALLEKTLPQPSVSGAVRTLLELTQPDDAAELNVFHPVLNMAQSFIDPTDPIHYVGYFFQHPRAGFAPKSIYQTEGVRADGTGDSYAPPHGIELGAVATGLPRETPGVHTIAEAAFGGLGDVTIPSGGLSGNLANGQVTGVLGQFVPTTSDGHFVVFDVPACHKQAAQFLQALAADPKGMVSPIP